MFMIKLKNFLIVLFFGLFGVHKFIAGDLKTGFLYLFTGGLFTLGWFVDMLMCWVYDGDYIYKDKDNNKTSSIANASTPSADSLVLAASLNGSVSSDSRYVSYFKDKYHIDDYYLLTTYRIKVNNNPNINYRTLEPQVDSYDTYIDDTCDENTKKELEYYGHNSDYLVKSRFIFINRVESLATLHIAVYKKEALSSKNLILNKTCRLVYVNKSERQEAILFTEKQEEVEIEPNGVGRIIITAHNWHGGEMGEISVADSKEILPYLTNEFVHIVTVEKTLCSAKPYGALINFKIYARSKDIHISNEISEKEICDRFVSYIAENDNIDAGLIDIVNKSSNYSTITYKHCDILRIKWTDQEKWIRFFMSPSMKEKYLDRDVFEDQHNKNESFWIKHFSAYTEPETFSDIVLDAIKTIDDSKSPEVTGENRIIAEAAKKAIAKHTKDDENYYVNVANKTVLMYYGKCVMMLEWKLMKNKPNRLYIDLTELQFNNLKNQNLINGDYKDYPGYIEFIDTSIFEKIDPVISVNYRDAMNHKEIYLNSYRRVKELSREL